MSVIILIESHMGSIQLQLWTIYGQSLNVLLQISQRLSCLSLDLSVSVTGGQQTQHTSILHKTKKETKKTDTNKQKIVNIPTMQFTTIMWKDVRFDIPSSSWDWILLPGHLNLLCIHNCWIILYSVTTNLIKHILIFMEYNCYLEYI